MQHYLSGRLSQYLLLLACLAGIAGLLASRALIAIAPIVGVVAALANPQLRHAILGYFRNGAAMRAAAVVVFLLVSGLYTTDLLVWRHELFRDLTWLAVPLAFTLAVPLTRGQRLAVGSGFVLSVAAVGLITLAQYWQDPTAANEDILLGRNMPVATHIFHITFGVMLALGAFWGMMLRRHELARPWLRAALLGAAAVAALTLHVLAYRTGLLVFYAALLAVVVRLLMRRNLVLGLALLVLLMVGPWAAYRGLESVRKRVDSSLWDVRQFTNEHDINETSLSRRLVAIETARQVIAQHWLVGVAPADARAAMMHQYDWQGFGLRTENRIEVHNQFLQAMVGGGVLGLTLLLALMFWPLTRPWARRQPAIGLFLLVQAASMLVDAPLDLQLGLNLFVFGYGFLIVAGERQATQELAA
ncbi:O-antigen ligase family protein [Hymenobacter siberiensis]|uniref:O-antigen ligase family protein n=1 Tax=Hymenobacter siberiensis TaxID=2848396 RepID=UPI001C1DDEEF|nr:O-antigen ligase family protein [Hymenobacter siberiensis]MBU6121695.1 O-antigen ligase family protein [Hymenobacter siberiensis]